VRAKVLAPVLDPELVLVLATVMDSALVLVLASVLDSAPAPALVHHNWPEPD